MSMVTGEAVATPDTADEIQGITIAHVERSRLEAGCPSHDVHVGVENPSRFVFVERWSD